MLDNKCSATGVEVGPRSDPINPDPCVEHIVLGSVSPRIACSGSTGSPSDVDAREDEIQLLFNFANR